MANHDFSEIVPISFNNLQRLSLARQPPLLTSGDISAAYYAFRFTFIPLQMSDETVGPFSLKCALK